VNSRERLVYMANQIARNFATMPDIDAAYAVADHIAKFWDPHMRATIFAYRGEGGEELLPVTRQALDRLQNQRPRPAQTRATRFNAVDEAGGSDAG